MLTSLLLQATAKSRAEPCVGTAHSGVVIVSAQKCRCIHLLTHPSHQLLHPHVQRRRQGDEGAQARVHRGTRAGLAFRELLVGVGRDAGGVGQGLLAQALGDAGAL